MKSRSIVVLSLALGLLIALVLALPHMAAFFRWLLPGVANPVYNRASFFTLVLAHLELVAASSLAAAAAGIGIGIFVTRERGKPFLGMVGALAAIGQTFPPIAVLALSVPLLGYGAAPTFLALVLYAVMPVMAATIAGLQNVSADAREAAQGIGFSPAGLLWRIELPLAAPLVFAGLRNAVIVNVGTATIGSSVGALSLGSPIIEGLSTSNLAYVVQGSLLVALLAVVIDGLLAAVQRALAPAFERT